MIEVGKDFWRSSCPNLCSSRLPWDHVQTGLEFSTDSLGSLSCSSLTILKKYKNKFTNILYHSKSLEFRYEFTAGPSEWKLRDTYLLQRLHNLLLWNKKDSCKQGMKRWNLPHVVHLRVSEVILLLNHGQLEMLNHCASAQDVDWSL